MAKKKRRYPELTALKGRIREKKTSYRKLAAGMGISLNALCDKINGFHAMSGPEMETIATILEINPKDVAYFFLPTYCETHHKPA